MEVLSLIVFLTGVALATSQCNQSKIEQCVSMTHDDFESTIRNDKLYDTSTLCRQSTITGFNCFKEEVNKCPQGASFMDNDHLAIMNRLTVEDLQKSCSLLSQMANGSISCFSNMMSNTPSASHCLSMELSPLNSLKLTDSERNCRIYDANYKCGLETARKVCGTKVGDDMESLHKAMGIIFGCNYAGNGSSSCNMAPTFLMTVIGVVVLATVKW
ncbi:hypothetical protein CHS0354_013639 [Potamilus streckersoni]|uniref:Uncharacterized protein n=1 Tax=Potamilus streckersoni TaxID=2493646 RepID=A0AAE0SYQ8_9BIVA|nr:hypothetical protein CHS0354_013639 [Potamilus streckersoni]